MFWCENNGSYFSKHAQKQKLEFYVQQLPVYDKISSLSRVSIKILINAAF